MVEPLKVAEHPVMALMISNMIDTMLISRILLIYKKLFDWVPQFEFQLNGERIIQVNHKKGKEPTLLTPL